MSKPRFITRLVAELIEEAGDGINNGERWRLITPLVYSRSNGEIIIVPAGFISDGASVPRVPVAYLFFGGYARKAGILHDYLLTQGTRAEADKVFEEALSATPQVKGWRASLMALAVRSYSAAMETAQ